MSTRASCRDCRVDTSDMYGSGLFEWYMVHNSVWRAAGMDRGFLCIGCLERRLHRQLRASDFSAWPVNHLSSVKTPRLLLRLVRS